MTTRSRERYGQLLLFAVLLFGIVTMHTVGHPSENGMPSHDTPVVTAPHQVVTTLRQAVTAPHQAVTALHQVQAPEAVTDPAPAANAGTLPMTGMNPLSVCLAVLGAFTLVLLLGAALGRPWDSGAPPVPLARLLRALWPNPPPPRSLLTRLSVLRQ